MFTREFTRRKRGAILGPFVTRWRRGLFYRAGRADNAAPYPPGG